MLLLVLSLPTENATVRQRAWRALKASGAAVLRDGVYLLPEHESCRKASESVAAEVVAGGGISHVLRVESTSDINYVQLFDRGDEYATVLAEILQAQDGLVLDTAKDTLRRTLKLRKTFSRIVEIDFFPGEPQLQTGLALSELEVACARVLSPDEPHASDGEIERLLASDYQGRTWATRKRPWVDRLASAWLIRRFIDPQARFLWLTTPADCPADAFGFDFDGATFSHVARRVTFEVLLASFGLEQPGLVSLATLVHYLDVGGVQPREAPGVEGILAGLRSGIADDDQLLTAASVVFDGLFARFDTDGSTP